jgi:hypothetical protein
MKSHLQIDGQPVKSKAWGETLVALEPGQHTIYCYARSLLGFGLKVAKSTTTIEVTSGQIVNLSWKAPVLYMPFIKGKWSVQAAPAASVGA